MRKLGSYSRRSLSSKEWHKELLLSWLFQTCFKLQAVLDRCFSHFRVTFQEAVVLMHCVDARETVPSRLALALGKDKGKITRFIDRLEGSDLVKRQVSAIDRRYSIIKATPKGKRLAERVASTFEQIREELFVDVLDDDIDRLGRTVPQLHRNALGVGKKRPAAQRRVARKIREKTSSLRDVEYSAVKSSSEVTAKQPISTENSGTCEPAVQADNTKS